jgi:hypothetical protein
MRLLGSLFLMLMCAGAPAAAEELGRLFLTPQQRQDLERRRATNRVEVEEEVPQVREGPVTLEGRVQRSSGKTATWINGVPQYDDPAGRDAARVTVVPNEGAAGVALKVGQTLDRASGEVRDVLGDGEIRVRRAPQPAPPPVPRAPNQKSSAPPR